VPPTSRRRAVTPPADTHRFSPVERRFPSLSLVDVLEARDAYHIWVQTGGASDQMWAALGEQTIDCMADGCRTLAMIWSSAWTEAKAAAPAATALDRTTLRKLYVDRGFGPVAVLDRALAAADERQQQRRRVGRALLRRRW
jgi:hypothetical protein